jgi:hypothetical protein
MPRAKPATPDEAALRRARSRIQGDLDRRRSAEKVRERVARIEAERGHKESS